MLLSHANRLDRIFILTQDPVLVCDVTQRIEADKHLAGLEIINPAIVDGLIKPDAVLKLAKDTVTARLLVFDVRSLTLPRLQGVYTRIVGYNRLDLNTLCYSLVIGDGPVRYPDDEKGIAIFHAHLSKMRIDYSPAAFFFDPLIHYSAHERRELQTLGLDETPHKIPGAWAEVFKTGVASIEIVRAYLRGADVTGSKHKRTMRHRLVEFEKSILAQAQSDYPQQTMGLTKALTRKGCKLSGEALRLYLYPMRFEKWLALLWDESHKEKKK